MSDEEGGLFTKDGLTFVEQASLQHTASPTAADFVERFARTLKGARQKRDALLRLAAWRDSAKVWGPTDVSSAPSNADFVGLATLLPRRLVGRRC
jgi:hypothetical protein